MKRYPIYYFVILFFAFLLSIIFWWLLIKNFSSSSTNISNAVNYDESIFELRPIDPDKIIDDIVSGVDKNISFEIEINRKEAIKKGISLANSNSVVLILGKGDEATQIIYDQKFLFSDKEEVLKILKNS